jgi:hypothetical protein
MRVEVRVRPLPGFFFSRRYDGKVLWRTEGGGKKCSKGRPVHASDTPSPSPAHSSCKET